MGVPSWVQDSIFYQIFPDRFANGSTANDPVNVRPWGEKPTITNFMGGDLNGIIDRMYYLLDLGINAIYLNPVFLSPSNHRYNITDYYQIDPKLGTKSEFSLLLDVAHRNEMKVILDGVFNHTSRGFFAFNDILENQSESPYLDWFHIKKFPVDAYAHGDATTYEAWWKYKSLPKLNTSNPKVRQYILDIAHYWIEQGIDGWRLDVPNEIDDDAFWGDFRREVKKTNPDAYLLGEIWDGDIRWVGEDHFDGLMNYPLRELLVNLLTSKLSVEKFGREIMKWYWHFPTDNAHAMYGLLSSHDVERFLTKVDGNVAKAKLGFLFLFAYPGAPALYYGDEIGLLGGADPDCRGCFPWDETTWNIPLRDWIKKLIRVRKERVSLRRGSFQTLFYDKPSKVLAFVRTEVLDQTLCLMNPSDRVVEELVDLTGLNLSKAGALKDLLSNEIFPVANDKVTIHLQPWSGALLAEKDD